MRELLLILLCVAPIFLPGQDFQTIEKDLAAAWLKYDDGEYLPAEGGDIENTIYFPVEINRHAGRYLQIQSRRPFFVFFNGQLTGEYAQNKLFSIDSLARVHHTTTLLVSVYQKDINLRDLNTFVVSSRPVESDDISRPQTFFSDFVVVAGLLIMVLLVVTAGSNPKLASDYFAVGRVFSTREVDDAQSNARLTNGSNVQFYVLCSLLIGYYLMIIFEHLPPGYRAPLGFEADGFWSAMWHWIRLSFLVVVIFILKILLIFSLTRLFGMRGLTRVHFFNWVRLMLIAMGGFSVILFIYFILRGRDPDVFVTFLAMIVGVLAAWLFVVFVKLDSKSDHTMFHLFSYICATELIPLLITIKVLFH